jgi:hypothetical protein
MQDTQGFFDRRLGHGRRHVLEWQVRRHQSDPQPAAGEHHHHPTRSRPLGQVFRMTGERHAGIVDHPLVYGCSDHCGEFPGLATGQRAIEQGEDLARIGGIKATGTGLGRQR